MKRTSSLIPILRLWLAACTTSPPSAPALTAVSIAPTFRPPTLTALPPQPTAESPIATLAPTLTALVSEPTSTSTTAPLTHTVQTGETLFRIALKYGVTVEVLQAANGIAGDTIYAGQVLNIPEADASNAGPVTTPLPAFAHPTPQSATTPASQVAEVQWDISPNALVIRLTGGLSIAGSYNPNYYIPDMQLWGDGRIIWVKTDGTARRVFEGRLTPDQMKSLLPTIVDAGFFEWGDYYDALGGNSWTPRLWRVNLIGRSKEISEHGAAPDTFYELRDYVKNGAGAVGQEFVPRQGYLTTSPFPGATSETLWPDAAIVGFTLDRFGSGRYIEGEALAFAWEAINKNPTAPVYVKSGGQVYVIMVQIPEISFNEPPLQ